MKFRLGCRVALISRAFKVYAFAALCCFLLAIAIGFYFGGLRAAWESDEAEDILIVFGVLLSVAIGLALVLAGYLAGGYEVTARRNEELVLNGGYLTYGYHLATGKPLERVVVMADLACATWRVDDTGCFVVIHEGARCHEYVNELAESPVGFADMREQLVDYRIGLYWKPDLKHCLASNMRAG